MRQQRGSMSMSSKPDVVQLEGVTLMKMLRHAESLLSGSTEDTSIRAEGKLVGLLCGNALEVTNCFSSPSLEHIEDPGKREATENRYQMDMLSTMRMFRQDHVAVGWYTTASVASFATKAFVEHQFGYQQQHDESIVLVIDLNNLAKVKASPGTVLAPFSTPPGLVRAYRLSDAAIAIYSNNIFTPATMKQHGLTFENIFEQLPVTVHNSDLSNVLLHQLGAYSVRSQCLALRSKAPPSGQKEVHQSGSQQTVNALQRHLRDLAVCAEELAVDAGRSYQNCVQMARYNQSVQQYRSRREAENRQKASRGEPVVPITDEEIAANIRQPSVTNQLPALLLASQLGQTSAESSRVAVSVVQRNYAASLLLNAPTGSAQSN